ncbi:MAG TPA: hypothetical protein VMV10_29775 [Pirellulales bacterium]|nr:hypothetical protein [Pirellulales bacterium]
MNKSSLRKSLLSKSSLTRIWPLLAGLALFAGGNVGRAQTMRFREPTVRGAERQARSPFQAALSDEPASPPAFEQVPPGAPDRFAPYEKAAPPPDPTAPNWGSLDQPVRRPLRLRVYEYLLAGPPVGILQRETTQILRRPVADPDRLLRDDVMINLPIDLYRPDGLAPIGVTGDHTLKNSTMLVSYRYSTTSFLGNLDGTHPLGTADVLARFPLAATRGRTRTHLMLVEYGLTDDFTILAKLPIEENSLDFVSQGGGASNDSNTQLGDVQLSGLLVLKRWDRQQIHLNLGMSIPVGIINTLNNYPVFGTGRFSYPVRTSSGSWDLMPGMTYRGQNERWTWGLQSIGTIRTGYNTYGYELGDAVDITGWAARRFSERWSGSVRLDEQIWTHIHGADSRLDPALTQVNQPNLQGGRMLDLLFGLNYYLPDGRFPGQRISVESGIPIYQSLHGPQLRARWLLTVGWNMIW